MSVSAARQLADLRHEVERLQDLYGFLEKTTPEELRFIRKVCDRLGKGRVEYGDQSFARTCVILCIEVLEELADVDDWSDIGHIKVTRVLGLLSKLDDYQRIARGHGLSEEELADGYHDRKQDGEKQNR